MIPIARRLNLLLASFVKGDEFRVHAFWSMGGTVVSRVFVLVTSVVLARVFDPSDFGRYSAIQSTLALFAIFATLGIGTATNKLVSDYQAKNIEYVPVLIRSLKVISLFSSLVVALAMFVWSGYISGKLMNEPQLEIPLRISSVYVLLNALDSFQTGFLSSQKRYKKLAINTVIGAVVSMASISFFTVVGGINGSVLGLCIGMLIQFILNNYEMNLCRQFFPDPEVSINKDDVLLVFKFIGPLLLSNILLSPISWLCNLFLINSSDGFRELGVYNAANQWRFAILLIPLSLTPLLISSLSVEESKQEFNAVLRKRIYFNFGLALFVALPIMIFSPFIMAAYGATYKTAWPTLILVAFSAILITVSSVIGSALIAKTRLWIGFFLNLTWAIVITGLSYIMCENRMGAKGLALALFVSYLIHTILQLFFIRNRFS